MINRLFKSGKFSDVTIISRTSKMPAHLNILSLHTRFFNENLRSSRRRIVATPSSSSASGPDFDFDDDTETEDSDLASAVNPVVQLHDFSPEAVERMLEYCYKDDYSSYPLPPPPPPKTENADTNENDANPDTEDAKLEAKEGSGAPVYTPGHNLLLHIQVYGVAKHVYIPDLQDLAAEKSRHISDVSAANLSEAAIELCRLDNYVRYDDQDKMKQAIVDKIAEMISRDGWYDEWKQFFENCGVLGAQVVGKLMEIKKNDERAAEEKLERVGRETAERVERETIEMLERETREKAEREEREVREKAEAEAREKAEAGAREKAEAEAKEKADC